MLTNIGGGVMVVVVMLRYATEHTKELKQTVINYVNSITKSNIDYKAYVVD